MSKEYPDYSNLRGIQLAKKKSEIFRNLRFNILKRHVTEEEYLAELKKYNIDPRKKTRFDDVSTLDDIKTKDTN